MLLFLLILLPRLTWTGGNRRESECSQGSRPISGIYHVPAVYAYEIQQWHKDVHSMQRSDSIRGMPMHTLPDGSFELLDFRGA